MNWFDQSEHEFKQHILYFITMCIRKPLSVTTQPILHFTGSVQSLVLYNVCF